jgi:nitric oxide reductase NorD protein
LRQRLAQELGDETARQLVTRLAHIDGGQPMAATLALLDELETLSAKAASAAIEALPQLDRRAGLSLMTPWLDLGVALAESSGATALKYFKDSPLILGVIEQFDAQSAVLAVGLEMAEQDANVTLEYLRTAPQILAVVPSAALQPWLELSVELTKMDIVVGLEYIRQIPLLAPVLPFKEIRGWLAFGMKLIVPNSLGKPDYIGTMEFLRTSPAILGDIEDLPVRCQALALGAVLADQSPEAGIAWLSEAPRLTRSLPSVDWQQKVLQYGLLLGEKDSLAALSYLRRCPEILALIGDLPQSAARFESWFRAGMEVLAYSPEGARAYFAVESQHALASVEQALSGVPLRQVARTVKLFVEGLCGLEVSVTALPDSLTNPTARATVSPDGRTIALPAVLRRYSTVSENERLYLLMAAHEAGHLEFGTFQLRLEPLGDLIQAVQRRYARSTETEPATLAELFRLYPHPRLIQDLWIVLEDARVEFLLRTAYPGLGRELAQLAGEAVTPRDPAHGLTVKELIIDCLLRLSTGEAAESAVPNAVREEVALLWDLCQPVLTASATAEDTVRVVHQVYVRMEELLAPRAEMIKADQQTEEPQELGVGPPASEETSEAYRPVTNWVYRGAMNPEFITREEDQAAEPQTDVERLASQGGGMKEGSGSSQGRRREQESTGDVLGGGRSLPSVVEELLALEVDQQVLPELQVDGERAVHYPEWDAAIRDYRINWCRVVERPAEGGSDELVSSALTAHRSAIRSLRRFFESLRPPAFRRVAGQADGDDLDIDAVVRRAAEQRAGLEGSDRVYVRREKRERDVAVAFLVDVSGSTSRQVDSGRRVIDVERESLVLLCEALDAVGDQYGLYAYSGQGRAQVDFLTIKDFDDQLGPVTGHRLGGLSPRQQNRDGAAIRHAAAKLSRREVKTRLLILLSDGRPLDGEYKDEYSLEDTKMALQEVRRQGIHPFCITIDREADSYLRRMYGDVQYAVIDQVDVLPSRLPRLYQRLTS